MAHAPDQPDALNSLAPEPRSTGFLAILIFAGVLGAVALLSIPFTVAYLSRQDAASTDVVFPLILIVGVIALVLIVAVLVGLFKRMDLADGRYALGLPSGSISAIIALMLILVFAMISVLVYINLDPEAVTVEGITPAQADQIPGAQVVTRVCDDAAGACTVSRRIDRAPAQNDIGKQLVTTVSTLVVAISAFYFGSVQTASAARRVVREGENDARSGPS